MFLLFEYLGLANAPYVLFVFLKQNLGNKNALFLIKILMEILERYNANYLTCCWCI